VSDASFRTFQLFMWRRLHALGKCRRVDDRSSLLPALSRDEWAVDAGYCLDRYSIEPEPGVFERVLP
jgi:hypothetical protein